jgi:hypothetical protein
MAPVLSWMTASVSTLNVTSCRTPTTNSVGSYRIAARTRMRSATGRASGT